MLMTTTDGSHGTTDDTLVTEAFQLRVRAVDRALHELRSAAVVHEPSPLPENHKHPAFNVFKIHAPLYHR
jgi:hypothetical protein